MGLKDKIKALALSLFGIGCTDYGKPVEPTYCMDVISESVQRPIEELSDINCEELYKTTDYFSDIPSYVVSLRKNAMVIGNDDCSNIRYDENLASEIQVCYEKIKDYLEIEPIMQCIIQTIRSPGDLADMEDKFYAMNRKIGTSGCSLMRSQYDGNYKGPGKECNVEKSVVKECTYVHEPAHIFFTGTILWSDSPLLNEGIAHYMKAKIRPGSRLECYEDSWEYYYLSDPEQNPEVRSGDYKNLIREGAACVWKEIEDNYGIETFRGIVQDLDASKFDNSITLNDILNYRIGRDGVRRLEDKFGEI